MKIIIQGELTDLNTYSNAERRNKYIAADIKKQMTDICFFHSLNKGKIKNRVHISFTWYCKNQMKDPDNIAFAKKFILDGIVKAKVIENDGWKQIKGFTDEFEVDAINPRVEVELKEIT